MLRATRNHWRVFSRECWDLLQKDPWLSCTEQMFRSRGNGSEEAAEGFEVGELMITGKILNRGMESGNRPSLSVRGTLGHSGIPVPPQGLGQALPEGTLNPQPLPRQQ